MKRCVLKTATLALLTAPLWGIPFAAQGDDDFRRRAHHVAYAGTTEDDVAAEIQFGKSIAARVLGRLPLYESPKLTRYVNLVGKAVAMHSNRPELEFRFAIVDADMINAYSAPGGYIFITKGALLAMKDEAELAGVLAHEIAHVTERHIVREFNVHGADDSALSGFSRLIGGSQDSARVALTQAVDKAVGILFERGYKHEDELDSDRIATLLLATTGYDPTALQRYLDRLFRMAARTEAVATTHPPTSQRLQQLDELINAEGLASLRYPTAANRFKANARPR